MSFAFKTIAYSVEYSVHEMLRQMRLVDDYQVLQYHLVHFLRTTPDNYQPTLGGTGIIYMQKSSLDKKIIKVYFVMKSFNVDERDSHGE